jgi:hypothetical protein
LDVAKVVCGCRHEIGDPPISLARSFASLAAFSRGVARGHMVRQVFRNTLVNDEAVILPTYSVHTFFLHILLSTYFGSGN